MNERNGTLDWILGAPKRCSIAISVMCIYLPILVQVKDRHAEEPHPSGTTAGNVYQAALDARREAQSALVDSQGSHGYRKGFESRKHAGHGYHTKKHNRKQLRGKR
jgi:hypothetical protein